MSGEETALDAACLCVEHETVYAYSRPVEQAQHMACLRPLSDAGQTLEVFEMAVHPPPVQHSIRRDVHGNSQAYFALHAAHAGLRVLARSQVKVRARYTGFDPTQGPTCGEVRERLAYHAHAPFEPATAYLYRSPYVPLHEALRDYAALSLRDARPLAEAAIELMHRVHADFAYAPASTDVSTPVMAVFQQRHGVCQDFAHVMLAGLRANGLAARYVSGYLRTAQRAGETQLLGADASHAWVSVWIPGLGCARAQDWLDLDPTNDSVPDTQHVRVAQGRDFGDVTPLRGVIRGGGRHTLAVRVTTRPCEAAGTLRASPDADSGHRAQPLRGG